MGLNPNRPASSAGAERLADTTRVHPDKQDQLWKERVYGKRGNQQWNGEHGLKSSLNYQASLPGFF